MKKLMFLVLLCSSVTAFAQKINFSGSWLINKTRTDFIGSRAAEWVVPKTLKIDQQADKLILIRMSIDNQLQDLPPVSETLAFDGTAFQRTQASGLAVTTSLHWLDNTSFTLTRKGTNETEETWTLEDNGKTLVVDRNVEQADGSKYEIKCYYDKQ
jgi:hypothetical protein